MRWLVPLLCVVLLPVPGAAQATTRPMIACPSVQTFVTQRDLARAGEAEAWAAFLEKAGCRRLKASVPVEVRPVPDRTDVAGLWTPVPPSEGGWLGVLYADPRDLRRGPRA